MSMSRKERQRLIDDIVAQIEADRPPRDDGRATPRAGKPRRGKGGRR